MFAYKHNKSYILRHNDTVQEYKYKKDIVARIQSLNNCTKKEANESVLSSIPMEMIIINMEESLKIQEDELKQKRLKIEKLNDTYNKLKLRSIELEKERTELNQIENNLINKLNEVSQPTVEQEINNVEEESTYEEESNETETEPEPESTPEPEPTPEPITEPETQTETQTEPEELQPILPLEFSNEHVTDNHPENKIFVKLGFKQVHCYFTYDQFSSEYDLYNDEDEIVGEVSILSLLYNEDKHKDDRNIFKSDKFPNYNGYCILDKKPAFLYEIFDKEDYCDYFGEYHRCFKENAYYCQLNTKPSRYINWATIDDDYNESLFETNNYQELVTYN